MALTPLGSADASRRWLAQERNTDRRGRHHRDTRREQANDNTRSQEQHDVAELQRWRGAENQATHDATVTHHSPSGHEGPIQAVRESTTNLEAKQPKEARTQQP